MPQPKSVTIAGKELKEVQGVHVSIHTPVGPRGESGGDTVAATVQLYRRAKNTPTEAIFKKGTNGDGRFEMVTGKIELQNGKKVTTYTIELEEAFISGWQFMQPPDDDALVEIVTLQVGKMRLSGGGGSEEFKIKYPLGPTDT